MRKTITGQNKIFKFLKLWSFKDFEWNDAKK